MRSSYHTTPAGAGPYRPAPRPHYHAAPRSAEIRMDTPELTDLIPIPQVWERLDRVEKRLIEASRADDPFLPEIAPHGLLAGGERFPPPLAQPTAEVGP